MIINGLNDDDADHLVGRIVAFGAKYQAHTPIKGASPCPSTVALELMESPWHILYLCQCRRSLQCGEAHKELICVSFAELRDGSFIRATKLLDSAVVEFNLHVGAVDYTTKITIKLTPRVNAYRPATNSENRQAGQ